MVFLSYTFQSSLLCTVKTVHAMHYCSSIRIMPQRAVQLPLVDVPHKNETSETCSILLEWDLTIEAKVTERIRRLRDEYTIRSRCVRMFEDDPCSSWSRDIAQGRRWRSPAAEVRGFRLCIWFGKCIVDTVGPSDVTSAPC